jgi:hypothetical protein
LNYNSRLVPDTWKLKLVTAAQQLLFLLLLRKWFCRYLNSLRLLLRLLTEYIINPLNAELNLICHLLALSGAHLIFHISRIRVNWIYSRTPLTRKLVIRISNYPGNLEPSGKVVNNSTKLTCLESAGYRIKYSTVLWLLKLQINRGRMVQLQVHTVNNNNRTSNCKCSLFSKKNPIVRNFRTNGVLLYLHHCVQCSVSPSRYRVYCECCRASKITY